MLEKVVAGWGLLFSRAAEILDVYILAYLLPFIASLVLVCYVSINRAQYIRKKLQFKIRKNPKSIIRLFTEFLTRYSFIRRFVKKVAIKVSMFTQYSFERNQEIACILLLLLILISTIGMIIVLQGTWVVWYVFLTYIGLAIAFMALVLYVFEITARARFTNKLPDTFKLLNSRYTSKGNILKAIAASMDDFDKAVRKEMNVIYDVLRKNDMEEIDDTFRSIESNYRNEYLTLLLNLIRQAHYKGGNAAIKDQFEHATEDVLLDIENQKDLAAASRAYIFLAIPTPFFIKAIEMFNQSALGEKSAEFYSGTFGIQLKLLFLIVLAAFIAYLLFLERTA